MLIRKPQHVSPGNLRNRLARELIYDSKQVLLYCGVGLPDRSQNGVPVDYLAFSEFLAGMAIAFAVNPKTKVINGAYPTLCAPGKKVR